MRPRSAAPAVLALAGALLLAPAAGPAAAGGATIDRVIVDPRITESSGLAPSLQRPDVLWTHNDSGNPPRLYAIGPDGSTVATLTVSGTLNRDWEAIASLRDPQGRPLLAVGDIGDNLNSHRFVEIVLVAQPDPVGSARVRPLRVLRLRYPTGPVNAEALLVQPGTGRMFVVTKELFSARVFEVPASVWPGDTGGSGSSAVATLQLAGETSFPFVTDGAFLPDGRIVLRNYSSVSVLELPARRGGRLTEVAGAPTPIQDQGESLAVEVGARTLLLGSEGPREPVYRIPLPGPGSHSPPTVVTASPSPAAGASGGAAQPPAGHSVAASQRESTAAVRSADRLIVGVGGVMALTGVLVGAGLMVLGWSRRRTRS